MKLKLATIFTLIGVSFVHAADVDVNASIDSDTIWSESNTYILKDYIFVEPGATLTIEAGTTVKADQGTGSAAPALIVTQGAKIMAAGTAAKPIVFTSILDTGSGTKDQKGLWGGLIILGKAPINSNTGGNADNSPLTNAIEGVPTTSGISGNSIPAAYAQYGGTDAADNSGVLQYVSIRHGGAEIGAGNEINGLTLGGVGNGTTIDHIEIFANKDDGIEFFGGSVNAKYLTVAYVGDDSFDIDEGYNGQLQFLLSIQDENSNRAIEWDGSTESDDRAADTSTLPGYSNAIISNMTAIGIGVNGTSLHEDSNVGMEIRDNAAGQVWNSIFTEFSKSILDVEATSSSKGTQSTVNSGIYGSQALLQNGVLAFKGNIFYNGGKGNTALGTAEDDQAVADVIGLTTNANTFSADPKLSDTDDADGSVAPFPTSTSPALTGAQTLANTSFLSQTTYRGAFAAGSNWNKGWTKIETANILGAVPAFEATVDVTSNITTDTSWSASNTYLLKDYIFVEPGATLTIEAGTTIKADQGTGDSAPALIVTQGAKIMAAGTAAKPIVFTSILDTGSGTKDQKGLWGGLIILGKAPINSNGKSNADNSPLTNAIEGVPTTSGISGSSIPAAYAQYGGTDAADNSGVLQYVSIRHGGAEIGAGNEINGLTLGGVGNGTTIDHIEIFANKDDGIEFFGGSVNAKHLIVAYVGDDSFDIDEGYNGQLQFLLSLQDENSNRAIEWDGSTESDDRAADTSTLPSYSNAIISNMTAIGIGVNGTSLHEDSNVGMEIRDNAAGQVWNSIFTEFSKSILDIEKTSSSKGTASTTGSGSFGSQALLENGVLAFKGNIFYNGGKGNTALGTAEDDQVASDIIFATANGNSFSSDPKLAVIGTVGGTGILATSAQPQAGSPAKSGSALFSGFQTVFLTQTTYRGAFDGFTDWAESWSKVNSSDYLATLSSDLDSDGLTLAQEITTNQNTDPSKTDTDGDGVADLTDPNPLGTDNTPSGLSSATNEGFVKQQYLDFLGRDGDNAGIAFWTAELNNGTQSRADCVNSFVFSEEFQQKVAPVSRLFLAYFMRIPDTGGLEFWINEKLNGKTISNISDSFAASTEFINTYGSLDNTAFVNLVYTNLFNRSADTGGFNYWKGQLDNSIDTRGNVMASFSESAENVSLTQSQIRVISFYYGMLRRAPDQTGYDFWVNELKIGKSPNDLINGFIGSTEYQTRFNK